MKRRSGFPTEARKACVSEFSATSACPADSRLAMSLDFPQSAITLPCSTTLFPGWIRSAASSTGAISRSDRFP